LRDGGRSIWRPRVRARRTRKAGRMRRMRILRKMIDRTPAKTGDIHYG
jgi:hypothetical protein